MYCIYKRKDFTLIYYCGRAIVPCRKVHSAKEYSQEETEKQNINVTCCIFMKTTLSHCPMLKKQSKSSGLDVNCSVVNTNVRTSATHVHFKLYLISVISFPCEASSPQVLTGVGEKLLVVLVPICFIEELHNGYWNICIVLDTKGFTNVGFSINQCCHRFYSRAFLSTQTTPWDINGVPTYCRSLWLLSDSIQLWPPRLIHVG